MLPIVTTIHSVISVEALTRISARIKEATGLKSKVIHVLLNISALLVIRTLKELKLIFTLNVIVVIDIEENLLKQVLLMNQEYKL